FFDQIRYLWRRRASEVRMASTREGIMRALRSALLLLLPAAGGCVAVAPENDMAAEVKPLEALKSLAVHDPGLAAKLELDPSVHGTWWTSPGRWDDPSRRIAVDWGPLTLIVYPSSVLELPGALIGLPASILAPLFQEPESSKKEQLRRLAEEA